MSPNKSRWSAADRIIEDLAGKSCFINFKEGISSVMEREQRRIEKLMRQKDKAKNIRDQREIYNLLLMNKMEERDTKLEEVRRKRVAS